MEGGYADGGVGRYHSRRISRDYLDEAGHRGTLHSTMLVVQTDLNREINKSSMIVS